MYVLGAPGNRVVEDSSLFSGLMSASHSVNTFIYNYLSASINISGSVVWSGVQTYISLMVEQ